MVTSNIHLKIRNETFGFFPIKLPNWLIRSEEMNLKISDELSKIIGKYCQLLWITQLKVMSSKIQLNYRCTTSGSKRMIAVIGEQDLVGRSGRFGAGRRHRRQGYPAQGRCQHQQVADDARQSHLRPGWSRKSFDQSTQTASMLQSHHCQLHNHMLRSVCSTNIGKCDLNERRS